MVGWLVGWLLGFNYLSETCRYGVPQLKDTPFRTLGLESGYNTSLTIPYVIPHSNDRVSELDMDSTETAWEDVTFPHTGQRQTLL